jgi:tetratricopeptide (TPR) repeat protein
MMQSVQKHPGDFDSAIKLYKAATKFGHSANLYGNLANLYFKNEDYGKSILHFNRALILNPSDSTLLANLNFALESKNIPKTERKFVKNYLSSELLSLWIIVSLSIFWSGLLLVIYLVNFRTNKKSLVLYNSSVVTDFVPQFICDNFMLFSICKARKKSDCLQA